MNPDKVFGSEPRRFSLPAAAALGMALGFYPGPNYLLGSLAAAVALASLGTVVLLDKPRFSQGSSPVKASLRAIQAYALAIGIAAGASVAWNEAGTDAVIPIGIDHVGASSEAICLSPVWAEGRLSSDSSPARNGFRSYPLAITKIGLRGQGISAELSFPRARSRSTLRVLSRAGPEIDAGAGIRVHGSFAGAEQGSSAGATINASLGAALFALPAEIQIIDRGSEIDRARSAVREAFRLALSRIGKASAGLLQALILGVRDSLAPEEADAFKAAGCSHILALSGEHLSVLALLAIAALRPLLGPVRARLGGAVLATLFMWIAGAGPSLLRSVLMVWIGAIALALDRPQDWLTTLALCFLITLPLDPAGARSLSFTLSYLAVWGLAVLGPMFSFAMGRWMPPFLLESASASLSAQAAVWPLLALTFGSLQFAGIPASMAAAPLVTGTMWWGMGAGLVCSILPAAASLAIPVSDFLYRVLMGIMKAATSVPQLQLPSLAMRLLATLAVAVATAFVYARPYVEYRAAKRGPASS